MTPADTYETEEELILILARNYQQWDDFLKKYNPVKIMIAKSFERAIGQPQTIPSDATKLPVPQILTECFNCKQNLSLAWLSRAVDLLSENRDMYCKKSNLVSQIVLFK